MPGIVSITQQSNEGAVISIMMNAHLPLIREVNNNLGPVLKISRK